MLEPFDPRFQMLDRDQRRKPVYSTASMSSNLASGSRIFEPVRIGWWKNSRAVAFDATGVSSPMRLNRYRLATQPSTLTAAKIPPDIAQPHQRGTAPPGSLSNSRRTVCWDALKPIRQLLLALLAGPNRAKFLNSTQRASVGGNADRIVKERLEANAAVVLDERGSHCDLRVGLRAALACLAVLQVNRAEAQFAPAPTQCHAIGFKSQLYLCSSEFCEA